MELKGNPVRHRNSTRCCEFRPERGTAVHEATDPSVGKAHAVEQVRRPARTQDCARESRAGSKGVQEMPRRADTIHRHPDTIPTPAAATAARDDRDRERPPQHDARAEARPEGYAPAFHIRPRTTLPPAAISGTEFFMPRGGPQPRCNRQPHGDRQPHKAPQTLPRPKAP